MASGKLEKAQYDERFQALLALLWLPCSRSTSGAAPPLSWSGRGVNPIAVHRSAWNDTRANFVGLKGGAANGPHGHMDAGSFILEADGIRWGVDLGMQDYHSLESSELNLWDSSSGSDRWKVFRIGPEAHNILRFDDNPPLVAGKGLLVRFSDAAATSVVNLDAVYADSVAAVSRGVRLMPDRSVLIQDEWCANANSVTVKWQFLTQADSTVIFTNEARLEQNKESLTLRVLAPTDVKIAVEDLSTPRTAYDAQNPGLKRLTLTTHTGAFARGSFRVLAVPGSVSSVASEAERPLAEWGDPLPEF